MPTWFLLSLVVAAVYGAHQVFARDASGRIADAWGALLVEVAAILGILAYALSGGVGWNATSRGVLSSLVSGAFAGAGTVLLFAAFRLGAPLSVAGPVVAAGGVAVMAVAGVALFGEPVTWQRGVGLVLAVAGIALMRAG